MSAAHRGFERALGGVRSLVVKPAGPKAWYLNYPFRPWRWGEADRERLQLLELLAADWPVCGFCLDEEERRGLSTAIGADRLPSPDWPPWLFLRGNDAVRSIEHLYVGDWCLFLFDRLPKEAPPLPLDFRSDAGRLTQWTEDIGASAGVLSVPDDREWLLVLPDRDDPDSAT